MSLPKVPRLQNFLENNLILKIISKRQFLHFGDMGLIAQLFSKCDDFCQLTPEKKLESFVKIQLNKSSTKEQGHQIIPPPPAKQG